MIESQPLPEIIELPAGFTYGRNSRGWGEQYLLHVVDLRVSDTPPFHATCGRTLCTTLGDLTRTRSQNSNLCLRCHWRAAGALMWRNEK